MLLERRWRRCYHHLRVAAADIIVSGERLWLLGLFPSLGMGTFFLLNPIIVMTDPNPKVGEWLLIPLLQVIGWVFLAMAWGRLRLLFSGKPLVARKFGFPYRRGIMWYDGRLQGFAWFFNILGVIAVPVALLGMAGYALRVF